MKDIERNTDKRARQYIAIYMVESEKTAEC